MADFSHFMKLSRSTDDKHWQLGIDDYVSYAIANPIFSIFANGVPCEMKAMINEQANEILNTHAEKLDEVVTSLHTGEKRSLRECKEFLNNLLSKSKLQEVA